jgi:hypothetical protein
MKKYIILISLFIVSIALLPVATFASAIADAGSDFPL